MTQIVAEFCQNHRGDRVVLGEMIAAAAESGADYAKIQTIRSSELTRREQFETGPAQNGVRTAIHRPYDAELARLRPLDLDEDTHWWFFQECRRVGIRPLTTVFTRGSVPFVAALDSHAVKIASYDCGSFQLLRDVRQNFENVYVSTGASHDSEIQEAVRILSPGSFSLLHCVTIYPTPVEQVHLARLAFLRTLASSVGFSDHTLVSRDGIVASVAAIALGASVIERHFTILPSDATRDGAVSIGPSHLKELVAFARMPPASVRSHLEAERVRLDTMLGDAHRDLSDVELMNRDYYRGRFATMTSEGPVYNWEERDIT